MIGYDPKLIDSNILTYAYDKSDLNKYEIAKNIIKQEWANNNSVVSIQNLVEFYTIITQKIQKPIDKNMAKQIILDYCADHKIIRYTEQTIINAINCQLSYGTSFWDALIVATMEENGISTIITENDKDFRKVSWLTVINPFKKKPTN